MRTPETLAFEVWAEDGWDEGINECLAQLLPPLASIAAAGGQILDLGCGVGRLALPILERYEQARLICVDVEPAMIAEADRRLHKFTQSRARRCIIERNDGQSLDALRLHEAFDAAFSVLCFQHVRGEIVRSYVHEIARRLQPGAPFRFQWVPDAQQGPYSHGHAVADIAGWCSEAGMPVESMDAHPKRPTWLWATARRLA